MKPKKASVNLKTEQWNSCNQRGKKNKKKKSKDILSEDTINQTNICIIKVPERKREREGKKLI